MNSLDRSTEVIAYPLLASSTEWRPFPQGMSNTREAWARANSELMKCTSCSVSCGVTAWRQNYNARQRKKSSNEFVRSCSPSLKAVEEKMTPVHDVTYTTRRRLVIGLRNW